MRRQSKDANVKTHTTGSTHHHKQQPQEGANHNNHADINTLFMAAAFDLAFNHFSLPW